MPIFFVLKLIPVLAFILFEFTLVKPDWAYYSAALLNLAVIFSVWAIAGNRKPWRQSVKFYLLPIITLNSAALFSFFLVSRFSFHMIALVFSASFYYFLGKVYSFFRRQKAVEAELEDFSFFSAVISFFFFACAIYGFQSFLGISAVWLVFALILYTALSGCQLFDFSGIGIGSGALYLIAFCVIMTEVAWAVYFFPFNFLVSGAILGFFYYLCAGLLRLAAKKALNKKIVQFYLIIWFVASAVLFFAARWI